jgi:hypothetical protein
MNELATQQAGTAIVNPGGNYFQSYGDQVSQRSIVGKLLKFSKGDFLMGEDNEEVEEGSQFVANMDELMVGWIRWADSKPTDQIMGRVAEGYQPQRRNELGDNDKAQWEIDEQGRERDPWQFSNYLIMKKPGEAGDDALFTFTTSSRGGLNAIGELCKTYGKEMRQRPDEFPIVALEVGSYQHSNKAYGRIKFPIFKVVGWAGKSEFADLSSSEDEDVKEPAPATNKKKAAGAATKTRF